MAGRYDFELDRGSAIDKVLTVYTDKRRTTLFNFDSYTARAVFKRDYGETSGLITLGTVMSGFDGIVLGGTAGTIHITISSLTVAALPDDVERGVWDLKVIPPGGEDMARRLLQGFFIVTPAVSP